MLVTWAIAAGAADVVLLLLALIVTAMAIYLLDWLRDRVRPLPLVGGDLDRLLAGVEGGISALASQVIDRQVALLQWAENLMRPNLEALMLYVQKGLSDLVSSIWAQTSGYFTLLSLGALVPVEREIPGWFRELERDLGQLPNEPAFRAGGPLATLLSWLRVAWAVAQRLGPFVRLVALPVSLVVLALWGLVELLGRFTRLETVQQGLVTFVASLDHFRQLDEGRLTQLELVVTQLASRAQLLQADLNQERAARVALAVGMQQALQAATAAQAAINARTQGQLNPLLPLAVLGLLGATALDVLRKTAECDPCGRLDSGDWSDLPDRVEALENFGP